MITPFVVCLFILREVVSTVLQPQENAKTCWPWLSSIRRSQSLARLFTAKHLPTEATEESEPQPQVGEQTSFPLTVHDQLEE